MVGRRGTPLRHPRRRSRAAQDRVQRRPRKGAPGDVCKPDVRRVLAGREGDSSSSSRDRARYEPLDLRRLGTEKRRPPAGRREGHSTRDRPAGSPILGWASGPHRRVRPDVCVERPMRRDLHVVWKTGPLGECGASETRLSGGCARKRIPSPQSAIRCAALRRQGAGDAEHREQVAKPTFRHTHTGRPMAETFDLIVIGTGSGGSAPAYRCRAAGWRVAVVDELPYGGTCALRGCDPKKVLVGAAELADWHRRVQGRGGSGDAHTSCAELMQVKRTFTGPLPADREKAVERAR